MMKSVAVIFFFLFCTLPSFTEEIFIDQKSQENQEETKNEADEVFITRLWSLDFMLLAVQLSTGGFGFGIQCEQQIYPHFAFKGYFGHATINTKYKDWYCQTVTLAMFAEWYPLSRQLRKFYIAAGGSFDYIGYRSDRGYEEESSGNFISFIPQLGYKFSLPWHFLIDVNFGYKIPCIVEVETHGTTVNYIKQGFQYSLSIKRILGR